MSNTNKKYFFSGYYTFDSSTIHFHKLIIHFQYLLKCDFIILTDCINNNQYYLDYLNNKFIMN